MQEELKTNGLDKLSWRILKELSVNARVSTAEIGRRIGLSSPAVAERIQKLESLGFITGHHCLIDLDHVGLTIQAFITFKSKTLRKDELMSMMESMPEIVEWHSITGVACVIMKVAAASSKELESIIAAFAEHGDTSTSLILSSSRYEKRFDKLFSGRLSQAMAARS